MGRGTGRWGALLVLALVVGLVGPAGAVPAAPAEAAPPPNPWFTYATMSDGVKIALGVRFPQGFTTDRQWPTLLEMDGYAGGGSTIPTSRYGERYVTVYASVRGTGCSGGRFDLFDRRHAQDGYEIIEGWITSQPWSDGKVGITGYSYPGLTGFLVASTSPPSLKAIGLGGLIDDLYRGLVYMGGVSNKGFPVYWPGAFRPAVEQAGNAGRYATETSGGDPTCAANIASRPPADPGELPFIRGLHAEDGPWWQLRALATWTDRITAPIHIQHHYQDEQTGPRGGHRVWELIDESVPKRLVMTNGRHGTTAAEHNDRVAWLDCWIIHDGDPDRCAPGMTDPAQRVRMHFETTGSNATNPPVTGADFPLPQTDWQAFWLRAGGRLTREAPTAGEASARYVALPRGRQPGATTMHAATASSGPDELTYTLAFDQPTAIAGPITLTLHTASTAPDTDLFATLIDVSPTGQYQYLTRGMLRSSHRAIDQLRSDRIASGPFAGTIYRPHRPHTNPELATVPGTVVEHLVEIFPVGHVFREGHSLLLKLSAPPATDPISELYAYDSPQAPAVVDVFSDAARPSRLLLPVLPTLPPISATKPACGTQSGVRCVTPAVR